MTPVDQTRFGKPHGSCFAACIASILELPLAEVDFNGDTEDGDGWWRAMFAAIERVGWTYFEARIGDGWEQLMPKGVCFLASGSNPAGVAHTVVWREGAMVHDPNPSRAGIVKVEAVGFLIPLQPELMTHAYGEERT